MFDSRPFAFFCIAALLLTSPRTPAQAPDKNPENAAAQTQPSSAARNLSFEVVSIHPTPPQQTFINFARTPDGFRATGITLEQVILHAYFPLSLWSHDRIQNVPGWVAHDRYDIDAKVASQDLDAWTHQSLAEPAVMRAMLLSMLADRCHLQIHTNPAEIPGFALTVDHRGASLRASTSAENVPDSSNMRLAAGGMAHGEKLEDGTTTWHFQDASIASLVNFLSNSAHTRVLDQTGLTGRYDFALAMAPDRVINNHGEITDPATVWDLRALGLHTVPTKVPTVNIVIDHIDPPSEN